MGRDQDKIRGGGRGMIVEVFNHHPLSTKMDQKRCKNVSNSYTMGCPPVRGDNPRALVSGLSYVQVDKHGITILYHLH